MHEIEPSEAGQSINKNMCIKLNNKTTKELGKNLNFRYIRFFIIFLLIGVSIVSGQERDRSSTAGNEANCTLNLTMHLDSTRPEFGVEYIHLIGTNTRNNFTVNPIDFPFELETCFDSSTCHYIHLKGWSSYEVNIKSGEEDQKYDGKIHEGRNFFAEFGNCNSVESCSDDIEDFSSTSAEKITIFTKTNYSLVNQSEVHNFVVHNATLDSFCIFPSDCMKIEGTFDFLKSNISGSVSEELRLGPHVSLSYDSYYSDSYFMYYLRDANNKILQAKNSTTNYTDSNIFICYDPSTCSFLYLEGLANVTVSIDNSEKVDYFEVNNNQNQYHNYKLGNCSLCNHGENLKQFTIVFDEIDEDNSMSYSFFSRNDIIGSFSSTNETHASFTHCFDPYTCNSLHITGSANFTIYLDNELFEENQVTRGSILYLNYFVQFGECFTCASNQLTIYTQQNYTVHNKTETLSVSTTNSTIKTFCFTAMDDFEIEGVYDYLLYENGTSIDSGYIIDKYAYGSRIILNLEAIDEINGVKTYLLSNENEILFYNETFEPISYLKIPFNFSKCQTLFLSGDGVFTVDATTVGIIYSSVNTAQNRLFALQVGAACNACLDIGLDQLTIVATQNYTIYNSTSENELEEYVRFSNEVVVKTVCLSSLDCLAVSGSFYFSYQNKYDASLDKSGSKGSNFDTFGSSCNKKCVNKPLLASTTKGQKIFPMLTSISGVHKLTNFSSPHYKAACWIIHDDTRIIVGESSTEALIQRYVMALLYYTLKGNHWPNQYFFLTNKMECSWNDGVQGSFCDSGGRVQHLTLSKNRLDGFIPLELLHLKSLEKIDFSFNSLVGRIPHMPDSFPNMKELSLYQNGLEGTIPSTLFNIPHIKLLDLRNCHFTGTIPRVSNSSVVQLFLSRNRLTGEIPSELYLNSNLNGLKLDHNYLHGTISPSIANVSDLAELLLSGNRLTGKIPSTLFMLPNIRYIHLSDNLFTGSIPEVFFGSLLAKIELGNNRLTGSIPKNISSLSQLEQLSLLDNFLTGVIPESFVQLKNLILLELQNNYFTGSISEALTKTTSVYADCDPSTKVICGNCTCYGTYTLSRTLETCEKKLTINFGQVRNLQKILLILKNDNGRIMYESEEILLFQGSHLTATHSKTLPICISFSGCFSVFIESDYDAIINATIDESLVFSNRHMASNSENGKYFREINIGYSNLVNSLQEDICDEITIDEITAEPKSPERFLLDQITQISEIGIIENTSSYFSAAKWSLSDIIVRNEPVNSASTQRYLLRILYDQTGGSNWIKQMNWFTEISECSWFGIFCDYESNTIVTKIDLSGNNLVGSIPSELGEFRGLKLLLLAENELSGPIPSEIANLIFLEELHLSNNILSMIPTEVGLLRNLKVMNISSNALKGTLPSEIGNAKRLEIISLSENMLSSEIPWSLGSLLNLTYLNLRRNSFNGMLYQLKDLNNLEFLDLALNFFSGSVPLESQINLEIVHLERNDFAGSIPTYIGKFKYLKTLMLYDNRLTNTIPSEVENLENLISLSVSFNQVKGTIPSGLGSLKNLKLLHLHHNLIFGDGDHFESIENYITDCGKETLHLTCTNCTYCCDDQEMCIEQSKTWPSELYRRGFTEPPLDKATTKFILAFFISFWFLFALCLLLRFFLRQKIPTLWFVVRKEFQDASVYRFLLTSSKTAWFVGLSCMILQVAIFIVFVEASDYTEDNSDWLYTSLCPRTGYECENMATTNWYGWLLFSIILTFFLIQSVIDGILIIYESISISDLKSLIAGVIVMLVTVLSLVVSFIYNMSTSSSNTDILKDVVILLFLNDMDEQLYLILSKLNPLWVERLESRITSDSLSLEKLRTRTVEPSEVSERFHTDGSEESAIVSTKKENQALTSEEISYDNNISYGISPSSPSINKVQMNEMNDMKEMLKTMMHNLQYLHEENELLRKEMSFLKDNFKKSSFTSESNDAKSEMTINRRKWQNLDKFEGKILRRNTAFL